MLMKLFIPCPPGAENVLTREVRKLGAESVKPGLRGVRCRGGFEFAYNAALNLRTASRLLIELCHGPAADEDELYRLAAGHAWENVFSQNSSFACRLTGVPRDRDPRYATLKLKDGIVDRFSRECGKRPDVDKRQPDIRIEARWDGGHAAIFLNFSGAPMHERGYRLERTDAVLRETTAAAILLDSGWEEMASAGAVFADPVCGSGTLLVEAAMIAGNMPPGANRKNWGFRAWKKHREDLWLELRNQALVWYGEGSASLPGIYGSDSSPQALETARGNIRRAGLSRAIRLEQHDAIEGRPDFWPDAPMGLICADPPYGERMSDAPEPIYRALGHMFRTLESGWRMTLLAPDGKTAAESRLRASRYGKTVSGGLDLVLAVYERRGKDGDAQASEQQAQRQPGETERKISAADSSGPDHFKDPKAAPLEKALKRNLEAFGRWAGKTGVTSYRIWDADMPEFNAAVDFYEGRWLHVQEYAAPAKIPAETTRRHLETLLSVLKDVTGLGNSALFVKTRQKGVRPYGKMGTSGERFIIRENGSRFFINLTDYLDSGIFLDHRPVRGRIGRMASGKRFLNLFAYTGSATVTAAAVGAASTVTVDVSNTYLNWARDNMRLNGLEGDRHRFVRSDAFDYLKGGCLKDGGEFDVIFLDPPTYSNGAGRRDWSVQDHHAALIRLAMKCLSREGILIFSENFRQFSLEPKLKREFSVREITRDTLDVDFARRGRAHRCWEIALF